jgi:hypothetical protein
VILQTGLYVNSRRNISSMKNLIAALVLSFAFLSCGSPEQKTSDAVSASSEGFKADSAYCAEWRGKINKIRKSVPLAPDEVKKLGLPSRFNEYEGDTSGFPLLTFSYFNTPMYGKTDLDRFTFTTEAEINSTNGVAEAERKNVWSVLESKRYLFIYYPESINRTGGANTKETVAANTKGVILVYDTEEMKATAAISVEASFDTGKPYEAAAATDMDKKIADEIYAQLVNNFVKH